MVPLTHAYSRSSLMLRTFHPNITRPIHTWKTIKLPHHFNLDSFFTSIYFSQCFFVSFFASLFLYFFMPFFSFSLFHSFSLYLSLPLCFYFYLSLNLKFFFLSFYVFVQWLSYKYVYVYTHTHVYIYVYVCNIVAFIHTFIKFVYTYFLCKNSVTIKGLIDRCDKPIWRTRWKLWRHR